VRHDKAPYIGDAIPGSEKYNPAPHPSHLITDKGEDYMEAHLVYTQEYVESIKPSHRPPKGVRDKGVSFAAIAGFPLPALDWLRTSVETTPCIHIDAALSALQANCTSPVCVLTYAPPNLPFEWIRSHGSRNARR
jgi:hypothetical protein